MSQADLTSREAVLKAIAEFDRLGRKDFLAKYKFRKERIYSLVHEGKLYPSNAIMGAAYGFQYPARGPLKSNQFSGGAGHVAPRLKQLGFTVRQEFISGSGMSKRNPPWNRDELLLALDLYFRGGRRVLDDDDPQVIVLSVNLKRLPIHENQDDKFRNPNGVAMKLANFRRLDPASTGGKGLERGNALEKVVWADFAESPTRLRATAQAIISALEDPAAHVPDAEERDDDDGAPEGRILHRLHRSRERNREIVAKRKAKAGERPTCEVCGFNFALRYGTRGLGFIECHHTKPVATLRADDKTRLADLALVCANCHRMLHRRPLIGISELRAAIIEVAD